MARMIAGILIGAAFLGAFFYAVVQYSQVTCEICMSYRGRQICETATAADEAYARMQATSSACSQLSSGVTAGIECSNSPPTSSSCAP